MEFNQTTTGGLFLALYAVIVLGTWMSPMQRSTVMMVSGGLLVFGLLSLYIGVKHGEYRRA